MPTTIVVQYRCRSAEAADENQRLVEDVFEELDALGDTGFAYTSLRLEDGVSFVHVVVEHGEGGADLSAIPAFQRFVAHIDERVDAPPTARGADIVGAHRMFAPR
jgi:hypothetical protein